MIDLVEARRLRDELADLEAPPWTRAKAEAAQDVRAQLSRLMVELLDGEGLCEGQPEGEPTCDKKINYWVGRWKEACEQSQRVEAVLVAADRVREAYDAMIEGRDLGRLPDWEPLPPVPTGGQDG